MSLITVHTEFQHCEPHHINSVKRAIRLRSRALFCFHHSNIGDLRGPQPGGGQETFATFGEEQVGLGHRQMPERISQENAGRESVVGRKLRFQEIHKNHCELHLWSSGVEACEQKCDRVTLECNFPHATVAEQENANLTKRVG